MPIQRVGPDANGDYYQAVTTAEWSGTYGAQLRASGYRYCGYGTWGIYVAGPGEPCSTKGAALPPPPPPPGPAILPPAETTGGSGSPPAPVNIGCGCHKDTGTVTQPAPSGPAPSAPAAPGMPAAPVAKVLERFKGLPWWVYVLGALALSQLFNRGSARA